MHKNRAIPKTMFKFFWHFFQQYKLYVFGFILCMTISGLHGTINAYLIKRIIDLLGAVNSENVASIISLPIILFILNGELNNLSWRGVGFINYKIQPNIKNDIINETFNYISKHSDKFFQNNLTGNIANKINILTDNIEKISSNISTNVIRGLVLLITALISMYFVHPSFFCGLLIWTICFVFISLKFSNKIKILSNEYARIQSLVTGQIVDNIANIQNIRNFSNYAIEHIYLNKTLDDMKKAFKSKEIFLLKFYFTQGLSITLIVVFMLYTLVQLRIQNLVTIGDFALILSLTLYVAGNLWHITVQIDLINDAVGKCNQSLKALFIPIEISDKICAKDLKIKNGKIIFNEVEFHYKDTEPLFKNKSIIITPNQKVGVVGHSGSGKTTFVNLIPRFYDVTSGSVIIDGQNIKDVTLNSLRADIGIIPQNPILFCRSIMDNIRYGNITATNDDVINVAKKAYAHEFIVKFENGYNTIVGERGINLSEGQRKRLFIARILLKNPKILILDEATSQLDSITEEKIQNVLLKIIKDKTTIIIAHRLSTLLKMDRILVFDNGKIVEDGTHQNLLKINGLYKKLWDTQVNGFIIEK